MRFRPNGFEGESEGLEGKGVPVKGVHGADLMSTEGVCGIDSMRRLFGGSESSDRALWVSLFDLCSPSATARSRVRLGAMSNGGPATASTHKP